MNSPPSKINKSGRAYRETKTTFEPPSVKIQESNIIDLNFSAWQIDRSSAQTIATQWNDWTRHQVSHSSNKRTSKQDFCFRLGIWMNGGIHRNFSLTDCIIGRRRRQKTCLNRVGKQTLRELPKSWAIVSRATTSPILEASFFLDLLEEALGREFCSFAAGYLFFRFAI